MLKDKVAIITGAAGGIGRAIARDFIKERAKVVIVDIQKELGERTAEELSARGGEALFIYADIREEEMILNAVRAAWEKYGRIDILVNNAGILTNPVSIEETTTEYWDRVVDVQLRAPFIFIREVTPYMKKQGSGRIVTIASSAGIAPREGMIPYSSSKAGVIMATRVAAKELAPFGICANVVAPGPTASEGLTDEMRALFSKSLPSGRVGNPEEVAAAVSFLVSDSAIQIKGAVLTVDGGRTLM